MKKLNAGQKAALTRKGNEIRARLQQVLGDRGLWDPTLAPEDRARNERFVEGIRRQLADIERLRAAG
jgi:hypothetical protein